MNNFHNTSTDNESERRYSSSVSDISSITSQGITDHHKKGLPYNQGTTRKIQYPYPVSDTVGMTIMLRQCCCGCSLGTGSLIIGIIETVGGFVNVILCIVAAVEADPDPREQESILDALDTIRVTNILIAAVTALFTLLSVLLIVGAKRNIPKFLVPWMVYTCFFIFTTFVSYVINTVAYFETQDPALATASIIGAILTLGLHIYFLLVVYSLYRELRGEDLLDT